MTLIQIKHSSQSLFALHLCITKAICISQSEVSTQIITLKMLDPCPGLIITSAGFHSQQVTTCITVLDETLNKSQIHVY